MVGTYLVGIPTNGRRKSFKVHTSLKYLLAGGSESIMNR
jgi:hypothetical protein